MDVPAVLFAAVGLYLRYFWLVQAVLQEVPFMGVQVK